MVSGGWRITLSIYCIVVVDDSMVYLGRAWWLVDRWNMRAKCNRIYYIIFHAHPSSLWITSGAVYSAVETLHLLLCKEWDDYMYFGFCFCSRTMLVLSIKMFNQSCGAEHIVYMADLKRGFRLVVLYCNSTPCYIIYGDTEENELL